MRPTSVKCLAVPALLLFLAACSSGGMAPITAVTSTTPVSTTPTTDPGADCRRLAEDAVAYLEDVVAELENVTSSQLADRTQWPDALTGLETRGEELDRRGDELGCDPGAVQQEVVLRAAALEAQGPVARLLLDLLLGRAG
jgi:hypothetical protein